MNNATWIDKLTGQIPGKTEGVSILTLLVSLIAGVVHMLWGIDLSGETLTILNTVVLSILGITLGSRTSRIEQTTNQVQAAQTTAVEEKKA
jgi:hypothetical protein